MAAFLIMEGPDDRCVRRAGRHAVLRVFESMLIPMFLIIGIWGGPRRVRHLKFFLYTFLGSVFMLIALIYMYNQAGSFEILDFHKLPLSLTEQVLIFLSPSCSASR